MAAFFDDSGDLDAGHNRNYFCLGMAVLPVDDIRQISEGWLRMIAGHLRLSANVLAVNGIEAKSSDIYDLRTRLHSNQPLKALQRSLYTWGLNTTNRVDELINNIWEFLATPPISVTYLASVANKERAWRQFKESRYEEFKKMHRLRQGTKGIRMELSLFIGEKAFEWLLQRLNYLGNPGEKNYPNAFLIGDENAVTTSMYKSQALTQAGFSQYTSLPKIANNVWFGSSAHNPCLQLADWVAFAVRTWAEKRRDTNTRLRELLPNFRGYPNNVMGWGIVPIPSEDAFPKLPI